MPKVSRPVDCSASFLISFAAVVILSGILMVIRFFSNISFAEPLHLITSGSEEQSLLSLWNFIHGQPVYTDPHKIPFTSSYLNWLFYGFYGVMIKGALALARVGDAWIPTMGRLVSFFFSAAGFFVASATLKELFPNPSRNLKRLIPFVSLYLFFGPLAAFWPLTVRPDIAATLFELLAFYVFLKRFQTQPLRVAFLAAFLAFIAWSFKQTNLSVILSLIIFSLIHERRLAAGMILTMLALCFSSAWLGGADYRASTLFSLPIPGFSLRLGTANFFYYLVEYAFAIPGYTAITTVFFSKTLRNKVWNNKTCQLCLISALVSSVYGAVTAFKIGASENYFIPASIFVTVFFLLYLLDLREHAIPKIFSRFIYFSFAINAALIFVILSGVKGTVSKRYEHKETLKLLKCTHSLPRPIFSQTAYLHLPWMLGGGPPDGESFIPGYTYWLEKGQEKVYEKGGIRGLIREGYFASLILEKAKIRELFGTFNKAEDGLKHYVEQKSFCPETHLVFIKKRA